MTRLSEQVDRNAARPGAKQTFCVRDFLRSDGVSVASPDSQLSPDDTLIHGDFLHAELRPGLFLHLSDVTEERAFTAKSTLQEGLSCIFFLDGKVDLKIGDRDFAFDGAERRKPTGVAIMNSRRESFERSSRQRQYLRHLVVSASSEWLSLDGLAQLQDATPGTRLLKDHLSHHQWETTAKTGALIAEILSPPPLLPPLRNLYLEGRAVELVVESLTAATRTETFAGENAIVTGADKVRLSRAIDIIEANLELPLSVAAIAREAGISASGLQGLFRRAEGKSVFEFVRERRLQKAFSALKSGEASIQEATTMAGYSDAANFATAFRKRFGLSPSRI